MSSSDPEVSGLTLGTVQFGLPYGVANRSGQPGLSEVRSILQAAFDGGIRVIDTAAAYGTSEAVIGEALHSLGLTQQFQICTKIRVLTDEERENEDRCRMAIQQSLEASLAKLRVESLFCVLFHRDADYSGLNILREYQQRGWMKKSGISASNSDTSLPQWMTSDEIVADAIQIPASPADTRYLYHPAVQSHASRHGFVFVRSIYLQGLLLLEESQIPRHLNDILPACRFLRKTADLAGMGVQELCLRFLLGQPGVSSLVVGLETTEQLQDNLRHWTKGPLPDDLSTVIRNNMPALSPQVLVPSLWESLRKST